MSKRRDRLLEHKLQRVWEPVELVSELAQEQVLELVAEIASVVLLELVLELERGLLLVPGLD